MKAADVAQAVSEAIAALGEAANETGGDTVMAIDKETGHALVLIKTSEEEPAGAAQACGRLFGDTKEGSVDLDQVTVSGTGHVH